MTETDSAGLKRTSGNTWALAAAVLGIVVILGLFGACTRFAPLSTDEPPIRVRGGTIELNLLTANDDWNDVDKNQKRWTIRNNGVRRNNGYEIFLYATNMANCKSSYVTGNWVQFIYGTAQQDTQMIEVKSTGNKTTVTARDQPLTHSGPRLNYQVAQQYIKRIDVQGNERFCEFPAEDKALKLVLIDP
jgi:hypothetical protein